MAEGTRDGAHPISERYVEVVDDLIDLQRRLRDERERAERDRTEPHDTERQREQAPVPGPQEPPAVQEQPATTEKPTEVAARGESLVELPRAADQKRRDQLRRRLREPVSPAVALGFEVPPEPPSPPAPEVIEAPAPRRVKKKKPRRIAIRERREKETEPVEPIWPIVDLTAVPEPVVDEAAPAEPVIEVEPIADVVSSEPVVQEAPREPVIDAVPSDPVLEEVLLDRIFEEEPVVEAEEPTRPDAVSPMPGEIIVDLSTLPADLPEETDLPHAPPPELAPWRRAVDPRSPGERLAEALAGDLGIGVRGARKGPDLPPRGPETSAAEHVEALRRLERHLDSVLAELRGEQSEEEELAHMLEERLRRVRQLLAGDES